MQFVSFGPSPQLESAIPNWFILRSILWMGDIHFAPPKNNGFPWFQRGAKWISSIHSISWTFNSETISFARFQLEPLCICHGRGHAIFSHRTPPSGSQWGSRLVSSRDFFRYEKDPKPRLKLWLHPHTKRLRACCKKEDLWCKRGGQKPQLLFERPFSPNIPHKAS